MSFEDANLLVERHAELLYAETLLEKVSFGVIDSSTYLALVHHQELVGIVQITQKTGFPSSKKRMFSLPCL
jgi:predicted transcriptional regulator